MENGATASPQQKKFATHAEQSLGTSPRVASSPRRKLLSQTTKLEPEEELADLVETSGIAASDGATTEDDSEVQCNLKTLNEQQRAMLRKSEHQLFMEIDQLTTNEAGHTDLAEIGNVDQSEPLSACELLGGHSGCDLLTREGSSGTAGLLRDNSPTVRWFWVSCALRRP